MNSYQHEKREAQTYGLSFSFLVRVRGLELSTNAAAHAIKIASPGLRGVPGGLRATAREEP